MIRLALAILLAFPLAALAAEPAPRTIDMTQVLLDQKGKPIIDPTVTPNAPTTEDVTCAKCTPLTLGSAIATALLTDRRDEQGMSSLDKAKRGALALRLVNDKAAVLTAKETADIVNRMNLWGGMVVVRALPILDPNIDLSDK